MLVCEQLPLGSERRIFTYCWKCSCTQNTFWGFYSLLQVEEIKGQSSSQDTAHKDLGFIFRKNAIAEGQVCLPGSSESDKTLTLTFTENELGIPKNEYTHQNGACSTPRKETSPPVLNRTKDIDLMIRTECWRSSDLF